jgi:transcriptional accessory protein Tex/SPT6
MDFFKFLGDFVTNIVIIDTFSQALLFTLSASNATSNGFVSNPNDVLKLHQHVKVAVLEVDVKRGRIQLKLL